METWKLCNSDQKLKCEALLCDPSPPPAAWAIRGKPHNHTYRAHRLLEDATVSFKVGPCLAESDTGNRCPYGGLAAWAPRRVQEWG